LPDAPRGPCSRDEGILGADPSAVRRLHTCDSVDASIWKPFVLTQAHYTSGMGRALVLNATDVPLGVVAARRAVVLVLKEKAEVVATDGLVFHSEAISIEAPSVVRLHRFVHVPFRARAPLTRRAVFARDDWRCQYCGRAAENLDHVLPRSRGGEHVWENVVAACRRCNAKKENRLPEESGLRLARRPFAPADGFRLTLGRLEPAWEPYL
jgi:5-methylcytosine-specific restriction endonuclease McrA